MENQRKKILRPTQHAREQILTAILSGEYPPGTSLPAERVLAEKIGVTRPTLRENLQSLAREGWITISHGRPTMVNNYWETGGLALLSTIAKYAEHLPPGFITQLLELRVVLIPAFAARASCHDPGVLHAHLNKAKDLPDDPQAFAEYDWELQELMARHSGNRIYPLILNDFAYLFKNLARLYFEGQRGRHSSRNYYRDLKRALGKGPEEVERLVKAVMEESIVIWKQVSGEQAD
ncbi:MAG: fatty acid metabolism transcriptional regulator FadR [Deltaproteobacteria bacterium]|nr:fatty acid metabolism transcriptional regulator FadR [Deltaproteobacteria bacterium]